MAQPLPNLTRLLAQYAEGDYRALESVLPFLYTELRRLAGGYLRKEKSGHTLQPTALVNEVFVKFLGQKEMTWQNRAHFFGAAAQSMRRILIDHARAKGAAKRGANAVKVELKDGEGGVLNSEVDLIELDLALKKLAEIDPRRCRVVELRYFAGLSLEETAEVIGVSSGTVKRDWTLIKAWLHHELSQKTER